MADETTKPWNCERRDEVTMFVGSISFLWLSTAFYAKIDAFDLLYLLGRARVPLLQHINICLEGCRENGLRLINKRLGGVKCPGLDKLAKDAVHQLGEDKAMREHIEACPRCKPIRDALRRSWKSMEDVA